MQDQLRRHTEGLEQLEKTSKDVAGDNKALDEFFKKLRELSEGR